MAPCPTPAASVVVASPVASLSPDFYAGLAASDAVAWGSPDGDPSPSFPTYTPAPSSWTTYAPTPSYSTWRNPVDNGTSFLDVLDRGVKTVGQSFLDIFRESNRNAEVMRKLNVERDLGLAARGFSTGSFDVAPGLLKGYGSPVTFPGAPSVGGGNILGSLGPWMPLLFVALGLKLVLK